VIFIVSFFSTSQDYVEGSMAIVIYNIQNSLIVFVLAQLPIKTFTMQIFFRHLARQLVSIGRMNYEFTIIDILPNVQISLYVLLCCLRYFNKDRIKIKIDIYH